MLTRKSRACEINKRAYVRTHERSVHIITKHTEHNSIPTHHQYRQHNTTHHNMHNSGSSSTIKHTHIDNTTTQTHTYTTNSTHRNTDNITIETTEYQHPHTNTHTHTQSGAKTHVQDHSTHAYNTAHTALQHSTTHTHNIHHTAPPPSSRSSRTSGYSPLNASSSTRPSGQTQKGLRTPPTGWTTRPGADGSRTSCRGRPLSGAPKSRRCTASRRCPALRACAAGTSATHVRHCRGSPRTRTHTHF
jgi:hypothetical protein